MKKILVALMLGLLVLVGCSKVDKDVYTDSKVKEVVVQTTQEEVANAVTEATTETTEATVEATTVATTASETMTQYPLTMKDKFGNDIVIESEPQKVISFSPELVEIMYAIDAGDKLIGRSQYCDYPAETANVPEMGDLFNLNIETIVETAPDLVLLSSMAGQEVVDMLISKGILVLTLDADTDMEGVYTYVKALGKVLNRVPEAETLIIDMEIQISQIEEKVKDLVKPSAYFIVGFGEYDSGATGDTFINQLMELAGATNVAADGINWMYSVEQVVEKDPQILICSKFWDTKSTVSSEEGYKDLTAVKENRLYEVDENIFFRQGPRMVEAIKVLAQIFHPEAF
ncbi:MAG: ABC transporter substrate-binding protein [Vallitaleaceae bacterium]|nr:ABC transporter substrate-binding protein [Vallitaleaceae bacterium]